MKKLLVVADFRKPSVVQAVTKVRPWLEQRVIVTALYDDPPKMNFSIQDHEIDFILVFGGDGLLLSTARELNGKNIPIMGVNFGKLGFLTEVTVSELEGTLAQILQGHCRVTPHIMLQCDVVREDRVISTSLATNEGTVTSGQTSRTLFCKLCIDNEEVATYGGDGIIVSTPIGSTAYSLSAGGPIVAPSLQALVITPICPHTLTMRPLTIPSHHSIEIGFELPYYGKAVFTVDGQIHIDLEEHDLVRITKATQNFYLLDTGRRSYFKTLQEKLDWGKRGKSHD